MKRNGNKRKKERERERDWNETLLPKRDKMANR